jgi:hypothetical protein
MSYSARSSQRLSEPTFARKFVMDLGVSYESPFRMLLLSYIG